MPALAEDNDLITHAPCFDPLAKEPFLLAAVVQMGGVKRVAASFEPVIEQKRHPVVSGRNAVEASEKGHDGASTTKKAHRRREADDTLESIKKRGLALEWELYPACIQLYARNRLRVVRKSYTLDNGSTFERAAVDILPPG